MLALFINSVSTKISDFTLANGSKMGESCQSAPVPSGVQALGFTPFGIYNAAMRIGGPSAALGLASVLLSAHAARGIASSHGRHMETPRPFRMVRREISFVIAFN